MATPGEIRAERARKLAGALQAVTINAQAVGFARQAIEDGAEAVKRFRPSVFSIEGWGGIREWVNTLERDVQQIARDLKAFVGASPLMPVGESWTALKKPIVRVYAAIWSGDVHLSDNSLLTEWTEFAARTARTFSSGVKAAAREVGEIAGTATDVAGKAAGNVVLGFLKNAWPILLIVGAVLGTVIYVAQKAGVADVAIRKRKVAI